MTNPRPSRLLIVDDNEMNRDMLARRLLRKGYVVGLAENAKELLERVKQDGVDLVLLDIEMPEISGLDALQKLRERYSAAELPIIMVTIVDNEAMGLDLGASNYLIKPVDRDRLAVLIEKHRAGRSATIPGAPAAPFVSSPQQRPRESEMRASGKVDHAEDLVSRR